jgi:hypothetical protein
VRRCQDQPLRPVFILAIGIHGEPPGCFAILRAGLDETQPAEMFANQTILCSRNVTPCDLGDPSQASLLDKVLKKGFLHAPAENAAGHDPGIDLPGLSGVAANDG